MIWCCWYSLSAYSLSSIPPALNDMVLLVQIVRIQNKALYRQYAVRKQDMDKVNQHGNNERVLWHGTDAPTTISINSGGFNRSFCGKNGSSLGSSLVLRFSCQDLGAI